MLDISIYKLDEKQSLLNYVWTSENDEWADWLLKKILNQEHPQYKKLGELINSLNVQTCLDLGCAMGQQYDAMRIHSPTVKYTGVDVYSTYIERCKARLPDVDYRLIDSYLTLPFKDGEFDVVTLRSLLDHYFPENGLKILNEAYRVCKIALIVKTRKPALDNKEPVVEGWSDKGLSVRWTQGDWDKFLASKTFTTYEITDNPYHIVKIYAIRK